jgi:hypothetical protein
MSACQWRLLVFMSLVAVTTRAAPPSTAPSNAARPWLERAAAELPKMRAYDTKAVPKRLANLVSEDNVALMLFHADRSEANRRRMVELARRHEAEPPAGDTPGQRLSPTLTAALLYAAADENAEAKRLLPGVKQKAAEVTGGLEAIAVGWMLPPLRAQLDDLSADEVKQLDLAMLAKMLESFGSSDKARQYAKLATQNHVLPTEDIWKDKLFAGTLAELGMIDDALRIADGIAPQKSYRAEAFGAVAEVQYRRGDVRGARESMRRGIEAAKAAEGSSVTSALGVLLGTARDFGDRASLADAADALAAAMKSDARQMTDGYRWSNLAQAYALLGRRADYEAALERFKATVAKPRDAKEDARNWLRVASVHAAAREHEKVADAVARSKAAAPLDENEWLEFFTAPDAYADAGDYASAAKAARDAFMDASDRDGVFLHIAAAQLRAGRQADATKTAAEIDDPFRRLVVLRAVVMARVRTGATDTLAEWIDDRPLPHERAILNLAVAQQMLGIEGRGMTGMFKMR